jgi:ATP-binding cassette subfamily F protein 3
MTLKSRAVTIKQGLCPCCVKVLDVHAGRLTPYVGDYDYYLEKSKATDVRSAITAGFSDARPGQDSKPASSKVKSAGSGSSNTRNISRKEIKKLRQEVSRLEEVVSLYSRALR